MLQACWSSVGPRDRLCPTTGLSALSCNSAFLDARQDDGFRKVVAEEFNELCR